MKLSDLPIRTHLCRDDPIKAPPMAEVEPARQGKRAKDLYHQRMTADKIARRQRILDYLRSIRPLRKSVLELTNSIGLSRNTTQQDLTVLVAQGLAWRGDRENYVYLYGATYEKKAVK